MTAPRFPIGPLLEALDCATPARLADLLGYSERAVYRWVEVGISWDRADRIAVSAGLHPATVWPEWLDWSIRLNATICDTPSLTRYASGRCRCHACTDEARSYQQARRARQAVPA